ncbi:MAG: hypothetical protein HUU17_00670 [Chthonomonadales bacterium]|nr:hypothetical protein [Chthonomonadales bacterium]
MDTRFLLTLSEAPGVATACGPVIDEIRRYLGRRANVRFCPDSHILITHTGAPAAEPVEAPVAELVEAEPVEAGLRRLLIAHMDEIGGVALQRRADGTFDTRSWGCTPDLYVGRELQGMDYLAARSDEAFPIEGELVDGPEGPCLVLRGDGIRPFRTVWTYRQAATLDGDRIHGKALDPRATLFAVLSAFLEVDDPSVGVLVVMAEECAMDMARKAVLNLQRACRGLELIVNADVPDVRNLLDADLTLPAVRIFEGRGFVDPWFGIRTAERLEEAGVPFHLTAARSSSQTGLFSPLAPTISVALPGENIHRRRSTMSLTGIRRCIDLLIALARLPLDGACR